MIKAVIFDVDGVLVDSVQANITMYRKLLKSAGCKVSDKEVLDHLHLPVWHALKALTKSSDTNELVRVHELLNEPGFYDVSMLEFPHNIETTLEVLNRKYKLAIVTSRIKAGVTEIFDQKEIEHLFDAIVTVEDIENPKPHPEPLLLALKKLKIKPDEAVYVGDMDTDIEAAKAAGMKSIHLSTKHHDHATIGIGHFDEIIDAVNKLNKASAI